MKKIFLTSFLISAIGQLSYAQWTTSGTNIFNSNTGNVGIGTSSPLQSLDVWGAGMLFHSTVNSQNELLFRDGSIEDPKTTSDNGAVYLNYLGYNTTNTYFRNVAIYNGKTGLIAQFNGATGNVGIGTTTPLAKLDVQGGSINTSGAVTIGNNSAAGSADRLYLSGTDQNHYIYSSGTGGNNMYFGEYLAGGAQGFHWVNTLTNADVMTITGNSNVLIGKTTQANTGYILDVAGNVRANQVVINTTGADFVFASNYHLNSLANVKKYIDKNHHLPEIASAKEMQTNGLNVGENQTKLLQKVEELTLYLIEQNKQLTKLNQVVKKQQKEIDQLKIDN